MARWGMPSPVFALKGKKSDPGITNVRNVKSPHWRRWLGVESRCVVPFTSFSERGAAGRHPPSRLVRLRRDTAARFLRGHLDTLDRRPKDDGSETTNDIFAVLTTEPNNLVAAIHPKAMPAILTTREEIDIWMDAPPGEPLKLQRPLPDDALMIVARGEKKDEGGLVA